MTASPGPQWPVAELDDVRRMKVLAASIPGASYAQEYLDIPFERVWAFAGDLETSLPALITDIRSFRIVGGSGEHLQALAVGLLGNRGRFDVTLRPGWCLMQSRFVIGGLAAVPQGEGTLFAACGGLRFAGALLKPWAGDRGAQRIIRRLRQDFEG
jgi:hypothetical protein